MKSLAVITTFPPNRWNAYAKRMLESHIQYWPDDVKLYAYHEGVQPDLQHKKIVYVDIEAVNPELVALKTNTGMILWPTVKHKKYLEELGEILPSWW
jgi:hypothetical protein